jgi:LAGLIDADG-like domain
MRGRSWTPEEDAFLRENCAVMSAAQLAAHVAHPWTSVRTRIRALNLLNEKQEAKLTRRAAIRHDYFAEIDSHLKAYILGWIASDGCISSSNGHQARNEISLKLHQKDQAAVELVRDELAPLHAVIPRGIMMEFRVSSARMKKDLDRLGLTPRKSLTLRYPDIPGYLDNSFILGCFDGDGCLSLRGKGYRWSLVSASYQFLLDVQARILAGTGIRLGGPLSQGTATKALALYCQATRDVQVVDAWLHADIPGLTRKRIPI